MSRLVRGAVAALALVVASPAWAQNVGALRSATWELPRTDADVRVINEVFTGVSAVQTECPEGLRESLAEERAYAACGRYEARGGAQVGRMLVDANVSILGRVWQSAWQENSEFGTVRTLAYGGATYYVALDDSGGLVYVIRFEE